MDNNILEIDKRFKWEKIENKTVLSVDVSYSTDEEKIAMIYRFSYYGNNFPKGVKKAYFLIKNKDSVPQLKVLKHIMQYAKNHNFFEKTAFYGLIPPIAIATVKVINPYLKHKIGLFKTRKEALEFLLN